MRAALLLIATGKTYRQYVEQMVVSAKQNFLGGTADIILWTDGPVSDISKQNIKHIFHKDPAGYPNESLFRYRTFLTKTEILNQYGHVFYADIDSKFVGRVGLEIGGEDITAVVHPSFVGQPGPTEQNPKSRAYLERARIYFAGGFVGGKTDKFIQMACALTGMTEEDDKNGVRSRWIDESYMNRYLFDNPPSVILDPGYCYPDENHVDFHRRIWNNPALGWPGDYVPRMQIVDKHLTVEQKEKLTD